MSNILKIEEVQKIISDNGLIWINGEYKSSSKRTITCLDNDGYKHLVCIVHLKNGFPPRFVDKVNPYTLENINLWLSRQEKLNGHKCISDKYEHSMKQLLDFVTPEGYKYQNTWTQCQQCQAVGVFEKKNPYVIYNIKLWLELNKPNLLLVSEEYISTKSKMKFKCVCGRDIYKSFNTIQDMSSNGCNCRINSERYEKHYDISKYEVDKEKFINIKANVYIIKCYNDNEIFYKIGITTRMLKERFCNTQLMPYNYDIVDIIETNMYDGIYKERELHEINKEYSYKPLIRFGGDSECFSELI